MKPSWKEAPSDAKVLAQNSDGTWYFGTFKKAIVDSGGWSGIGTGKWYYTGKQTDPEYWETSLERYLTYNLSIHSSPDAKDWAELFVDTMTKQGWTINDIDEGLMVGWFANAMMAMYNHVKPEKVWNGEGFPPSDTICMFDTTTHGLQECQTLGVHQGLMVCILTGHDHLAPIDKIRFGGAASYTPKPSQKEEWCKEVLQTLQLDDKTTPEDVVGMMYKRFQQGDIKPPEEET